MRELGTRLRGLAALLALAAILVGVPAALVAVGAVPTSVSLPAWSEIGSVLTRPDDGSLLVGLLMVIAWVTWVTFAVSIVLEAIAQVRRLPTPRLPGLSLQQRASHGLVSMAALLFATAPLVTGAPSAAATGPAPPPAPVPAAATVGATTEDVGSEPSAGPSTTEAPDPATRYTVQPGDTLWDIADRQLRDGYRWREIADLNYGRPQPGGTSLGPDNWVYPGWQLLLPPPATDPVPAGAGTYVVQPGDTLWDIADRELGDGQRYPEIVAASRGIEQPGGYRLVDPDQISEGWTLRIPATPPQADVTPADASSEPSATPPSEESSAESAEPTEAAAEAPQPPVTPDAAAALPLVDRPGAGAPAAEPAPADAAPVPAEQADTPDPVDLAPLLRTTGGVGALLAAGLLALWAGHRQWQRWRTRPGQQPRPVEPAAVSLLEELSQTQDPMSRDLVNRALRTLGAHCTTHGDPLPRIAAATLSAEDFTLYLAEPASLPPPWQSSADGWVWQLTTDRGLLDAEQAAQVPAPYPALVTLGQSDHAHLLVDLEQLGALDVAGEENLVRDVTAALALELAVSEWADHVTVTVVGGFAELEGATSNGRLQYAPTAERYLDTLEVLAADTAAVFGPAGHRDAAAARAAGASPDLTVPEVVVFAAAPTARQRDRLAELLTRSPRPAIAAVTPGVEPLSPHLLRIQDGDSAVFEPSGSHLMPQRLDEDTYRRLVSLLGAAVEDPREDLALDDRPAPVAAEAALADLPDPVDALDPQEAPADAADASGGQFRGSAVIDAAAGSAAADPAAAEPGSTVETAVTQMPHRAPYLRVLGDVQVDYVSAPREPRKLGMMTEITAYLAFHPGASHGAVKAAIWPRREPAQNTFNTAVTKTRRWLGTDPDGHPYLPHADGAHYSLAGVGSDWQDWCALVPSHPREVATDHLTEALRLVRGYPFTGPPTKYWWAIGLQEEITAAVSLAAEELARRRTQEGRYRDTLRACEAGLAVAPADQELWRLRVMAAVKLGDEPLAHRLVTRLADLIDVMDGDADPETERLMRDLRAGRMRLSEAM